MLKKLRWYHWIELLILAAFSGLAVYLAMLSMFPGFLLMIDSIASGNRGGQFAFGMGMVLVPAIGLGAIGALFVCILADLAALRSQGWLRWGIPLALLAGIALSIWGITIFKVKGALILAGPILIALKYLGLWLTPSRRNAALTE